MWVDRNRNSATLHYRALPIPPHADRSELGQLPLRQETGQGMSAIAVN
jgi:hypothetical protein